MDSLSQIVLGASVAATVVPRGHRRKALIAGAALGTLPDLDVFIDFGGAVENFTYHRGFSHSLFVLAPVAVLLWLALRRWWLPARDAPYRWFAAVSLALLTHPLLDAHTAYGTQLFWPLDVAPAMWGTLFIIDPLYTLPLLAGVLAVAFRPDRPRSAALLNAGLAISSTYVAWSWLAQGIVMNNTQRALADLDLDGSPAFVTPTPFNTLLWRAVVMTDDGYLEGFDSLLVDEGTMNFRRYPSGSQLLEESRDVWAVNQLRWFAQDFVAARVEQQSLVMSDLRMGQAPTYVFNHRVAVRSNPHWQAVPTELLPGKYDRSDFVAVWHRIWRD